jgi:leader peptidase (prepilin peptidase)/N-methyltransferase
LFEFFYSGPFSIALFFVLGAIFGSFANVIIYRLPMGESIVWPGSCCQSCKQPIAWVHNVPIIAWFWLRGRCAKCGEQYSFRYPLVEFLMGLLFACAIWRLGWSWTTIEALFFIFAAVTASFIDLDHMILPDKFTLSGIVIGLVGAAFNPEREFLDALFGVLAGGGFLWAVAYLYYAVRNREGMGGGDIKLLAWIGALLGWKAIPIVILLSSLGGSFVGITLALRTKDGMKRAIPFGPYLVGAAIIYWLFNGESWAAWYLAMHGL